MDFLAVSFVVNMSDVMMHSFCLLASMKRILIPNCSILYLHSNDMNSLKRLFLKKSTNIIVKRINKVGE